MSATARRTPGRDGLTPETVLLWAVLAVVMLAAGLVTGAVQLANVVAARPQRLPGNPAVLVVGLAHGQLRWTPAATGCLAALVMLLLGAGAGMLVLVLVLRRRRTRSRVDGAARHLARGRDLGELAGKAARTRAARLGMPNAVGLVVARALGSRQPLYQGWEDTSVDVWGPRSGKTTSRAIPALLAAPGAALATSNKRDLLDATRDPRADAGTVWVFDPQAIADEQPGWWWNPLSYVDDEVKAAILAGVLTGAAREPGSRTDAYFEPRAQQLLADLLLAAALDGRQLTQVYLWLTSPTEYEPVAILHEHGYPLNAASVDEAHTMPDKQRGGVYGTAQRTVAFMTNRQAMRWVTSHGPADSRPEFDPAAFVAGSGTLYSLSKEGHGSAGPLVTALTVAVTEAAEQRARRSPGGRLPTPLVAVLDEAANVCRWRELPDLYSHYGSRGIVLMTILQSWSQGVEVWGRDGMRKLWSAANVKVYGGGVHEREFLAELSELIGDYELTQTSTSHGKTGRSTSASSRRERVLDVADLGALPRGRVIVLGSGARPTLAATLPWMDGPHAAEVLASIAAHDPAAAAERATAGTVAAGADRAAPAAPGGNPWVRHP